MLRSKSAKRILKNSIILAANSFVTKGILLVVFVFVARFFGPEDYGAYSTALTYVAIMAIFSKLGFDMTVLREGARQTERIDFIQNKIFPLRLWTSLFAFVMAIVVAFVIGYDTQTLKLIIILSLLIISGGAVASGLLEHYSTTFLVLEKMQYVALVNFFRIIIFSLCVLGLLFFDIVNVYLLAGCALFSSVAALFFQIYNAGKVYRQKINLKIDWNFTKRIYKPVLFFGIIALLNIITMRVDIQMLNMMKGNEEVGVYSVAWQIVFVGITLVQTFSVSLFPNSARNIFKAQFRSKLLKYLLGGSLLVSLGCMLGTYLSEPIITFAFGEAYAEASAILTVLIWFVPIRLISLWGHQILEGFNLLVERIVIFGILAGFNIFLNYLFIPQYGAYGAAVTSLVTQALLMLTVMFIAFWKSRTDEQVESYRYKII
jgi:O-antigen/teichoic acid export membrane protein